MRRLRPRANNVDHSPHLYVIPVESFRGQHSHGDQNHSQQPAARARRGPRDAPAVGDPGPSPAHRHQVRLRHGSLRSVHRPHRRAGHTFLRHAGFRSRRQEHHHHRRARDPRRQGRAGLVGASRCAPVRLLPERPDHVGVRAARFESEAERCGYRRRDERQHLPVRNLCAHSRRHSRGRRRAAGQGDRQG